MRSAVVPGATAGLGPDAIVPSGIVQPIYARIPANQNPPPGRYTDLIEITVEW